MANQSTAENLEEMEGGEHAIHNRHRKDTNGLPADTFAIFEDRESTRQRQLEEFLEQQRQENTRLREFVASMAPNYKSSRVVNEGHDVLKAHSRKTRKRPIIGCSGEQLREDLEIQRTRVRDLEGELAKRLELPDDQHRKSDDNAPNDCTNVYDTVQTNHEDIQASISKLNSYMFDCKRETARLFEQEELRRKDKDARRVEKEENKREFKELLLKIAANKEESRREAEEKRRRAKERPRLEEIIAQLRQQNAEQRRLLVTLLDEHCNAGKHQLQETIDAAVGNYVHDSESQSQ